MAVWLVLSGAGWGAPIAWAQTTNRIIAIVNEEVITEADLDSHLSSWRAEQELPPGHDADALREVVLQRLIEQRLLVQEAKRIGVVVESEETAARLDELKKGFPSEEEFERELAVSHLSRERLKEELLRQLMIQRLIDEQIRSTIVVSPLEITQELAAHGEHLTEAATMHLVHLLIRVNETRTEEEAKTLIETLHQQLTAGAEWRLVASRYAEDPHQADGGDMGWITEGALLPELNAVLVDLKTGELSRPIQTPLGFHLLRVEERRPVTARSNAEATRLARRALAQRKFEANFTRWMDQLQRRSYIEVVRAEED
jgi:peptidyl-prolyl cis-trans isomerase SurA